MLAAVIVGRRRRLGSGLVSSGVDDGIAGRFVQERDGAGGLEMLQRRMG